MHSRFRYIRHFQFLHEIQDPTYIHHVRFHSLPWCNYGAVHTKKHHILQQTTKIAIFIKPAETSCFLL